MLMQMGGSEADASMLRRTEEAYSQLKADFAQLAGKYTSLKTKHSTLSGLGCWIY